MTKRVLSVLTILGLLLGALSIGAVDAGAKKKKKKKVKKCAPYKPGEEGAEADTSKVTHKATADKPVEVTLATSPGLGVGGEDATETFISHVYHNVLVDSKAKSSKLFVRIEIVDYEDQDLYLLTADGVDVAHAAGFNPAPEVYNDTSGGGHTEQGAEQIDGVTSADCTGYTVDVAAATGVGEDVLLKLWLEK
jgi:hypothetical protein